MGVSYREYIKSKKIKPEKAPSARRGEVPTEWQQAKARAAVRKEYFAKSSRGRAAALAGQKRLIEDG